MKKIYIHISDADKMLALESIRMKAVVTPVNLNWTLYELTEQLAKEIQ